MVFNLDSSVSNEELHQIFGVYGEIKEVRLFTLVSSCTSFNVQQSVYRHVFFFFYSFWFLSADTRISKQKQS